MNIRDFQLMKEAGKKISVVTCYDYWSAKIISTTDIDCVLVGDSLAMVMHGHSSTLPATVDLMVLHTQAVARGIEKKFIIADMPFLAHRKGLSNTMSVIEKLMLAGAHAIKIEKIEGNEESIKHIVESGVPVMGHLGMTPQSIHQLGGFCVQGKQQGAEQQLLSQALSMQKAGCFSIVLECIPSAIAQKITQELIIPTIGIGAGSHVDGQVLVFHDLLGMNGDFKPKFLKKYFDGFFSVQSALNNFNDEVKKKIFPSNEHCY